MNAGSGDWDWDWDWDWDEGVMRARRSASLHNLLHYSIAVVSSGRKHGSGWAECIALLLRPARQRVEPWQGESHSLYPSFMDMRGCMVANSVTGSSSLFAAKPPF